MRLATLLQRQNYRAISQIAPEAINLIPLQERFQAIAHINNAVLHADPATAQNPNRPLSEEYFQDEINALVQISMSMEHTQGYKTWLKQCRLLLIKKLYDHDEYVLNARLWRVNPEERKKTIRLREKMHTDAAKSISNINYVVTPIQFPVWEPTKHIIQRENIRNVEYSNIVCGSFTGMLTSGNYNPSSMKLNTHPQAFDDADNAQNTHHHEKTHALGFQLATVFKTFGHRAVSPFAYDAELNFHLYNERAVISHRIEPAYLSQFHERIAFYEGDAAEHHFKNRFPRPFSQEEFETGEITQASQVAYRPEDQIQYLDLHL